MTEIPASRLFLLFSHPTLLRNPPTTGATIVEHVNTKPHSGALLLSAVFAAGLVFAQASPAQEASSESPGPYATYLMSVGGMGREQALNAARGIDRRQAVAPEKSAQPTPAQEASSESPGPYARYLMSAGGMGREQALNAARGIDRANAPEQLAQPTPAQEASSESPGPYAKYLMSVGSMSREQALNAARGMDRNQAVAHEQAIEHAQAGAQPGPDAGDPMHIGMTRK
jgi:hypothetical protein